MIDRDEYDARGRLTYQNRKLRRALALTKGRGVVVDVGAHCGLWAMQFASEFQWVHAFEPIPAHIECLMRNCADCDNVQIHAHALGNAAGRVTMHTEPTSSGDSYPAPGVNDGATLIERYDDLQIAAKIDLVKLDCEGFELFALQGMAEMLARDQPAIVVEQKPGKAQKFGIGERDAVKYLESIGYTVQGALSGDFFLTR